MASSAPLSSTAAGRPFGSGLRDIDMRLMVASADVRYRQKLKAVIVRRDRETVGADATSFAVELLVLNTAENIAVLQEEANLLDPNDRLQALRNQDLVDVVLKSSTTGERAMITAVKAEDFRRIEAVAALEPTHIGTTGEDRGSWVCRFVDAERIDALFGGTIIDIRR